MNQGVAESSGTSRASPSFSERPGTLRAGTGEPLFLLHGVTGSASMWRALIPLLAPHHDVIALTALGHRGGPQASRATITQLIDDVERCLDELELARAHFAGNSMGGWIALELARRGRALSVCALSPAGIWDVSQQAKAVKKLRAVSSQTRLARRVLPLLARSAQFRRWALRDTARHGDRVRRSEFLELADDLLGCQVRDDLFATTEALSGFDAACPITLAWSEYDRIFPLETVATRARALISGARFVVLEDAGHVPMLDAPERVAQVILRASGGLAPRPRARQP